METRRRGDGGTRRRGETLLDLEWKFFQSKSRNLLSVSPCSRVPVPVSQCLRVSVSPCTRSPCPRVLLPSHLNVGDILRIQALHEFHNPFVIKLGIVCFDHEEKAIASCKCEARRVENRMVRLW